MDYKWFNNMLTDSIGRTINYLRVSITDRCNLRCVYCMPPEGVKWKPHDNILTFEEILRLVKIMAVLGVKNVKVTGGEPLLRKGAHSFLKDLKLINGIEKVTLTTNGLLLNSFLNETEENALPNAINISLDALDINRYKQITGLNNDNSDVFTEPKAILSVINRLLEKQITVKINCVPIRSINEEEIIPIAELAKNKNIIVRFIELMPIGCA
ncbi:MAG: radical SAM protein, partial [Treponema sp.]|nr:radical SAM protein [Treponema sp.]